MAYPPAIVFLFIGFSNCDIEICGGNSDAWDNQGDTDERTTVNGHLPGQPCSTQCPNMGNTNPKFPTIWNQVRRGSNGMMGGDNVTQQSFLYQIYNPSPPLVGPHVVVFNGALGNQTLDRWDPYDGHYTHFNDCGSDVGDSNDTECNYDRVQIALQANGYSEAQVQAIFVKASNPFPHCDLNRGPGNCNSSSDLADAYIAEKHLANVLRYLRCCELPINGNPHVSRYPRLQQVFLTSRTYGGYANGNTHGCLNPEPFAYELAFSVQRLIVAQINQDANVSHNDPYSGDLHYNPEPNVLGGAPWFDWGPYLWADGTTPNSAGLFWCDSTTTGNSHCTDNPGDFRYGDLINIQYFGDHTHPTATGTQKVANELVKFIQGNLLGPQHFISDWVGPWVLTK